MSSGESKFLFLIFLPVEDKPDGKEKLQKTIGEEEDEASKDTKIPTSSGSDSSGKDAVDAKDVPVDAGKAQDSAGIAEDGVSKLKELREEKQAPQSAPDPTLGVGETQARPASLAPEAAPVSTPSPTTTPLIDGQKEGVATKESPQLRRTRDRSASPGGKR